jgi:hypothetical protein
VAGPVSVSLAVTAIQDPTLTGKTLTVTVEVAKPSTDMINRVPARSVIAVGQAKAIDTAKVAAVVEVQSDLTQGGTMRTRFKVGYDPARVVPGRETALRLARFYDATGQWLRYRTMALDTVNNTIEVETNGFSVWMVADTSDAQLAGQIEVPVPVELAVMDGRFTQDHTVMLSWTTESETNNFGFFVERSADGLLWEEVGFIEGHGTTSGRNDYAFQDGQLPSGVNLYYYRLRQMDFNGATETSPQLEVRAALPKQYALGKNYPNPFNPTTTITFQLPDAGRVSLKVYNLLGQVVATLVDEDRPAGSHVAFFNSSHLASGMYIYQIQVNGFRQARKMLLLR